MKYFLAIIEFDRSVSMDI